MDACGCDRGFEIFDRAKAEGDLREYRKHGPAGTTRMLLDMLRARGIRGADLLDIGGGIGVIDHELLRDGVAHAVLVDASAPSLEVARTEARRSGVLDRIEFVDGDVVGNPAAIDDADIVTLDRVICCYPDVDALVRASASRARSLYGIVLPRDRRITRWLLRLGNVWFRLRGFRYRSYAHPNGRVDALAAEAGLRIAQESGTFIWRVVLYDREASPV
jgi:magnesium-protoporphyrin O-methyltransferase